MRTPTATMPIFLIILDFFETPLFKIYNSFYIDHSFSHVLLLTAKASILIAKKSTLITQTPKSQSIPQPDALDESDIPQPLFPGHSLSYTLAAYPFHPQKAH